MTVTSSSSTTGNGYPPAHDVFLSFRGDDTRNGFTAHLHAALCRAGINTFIDEEGLREGDTIKPSLLDAIEGSSISIVVLSPNYASSSWCLDELVKILGCRESMGQRLLPVFYKVEPSDVRRQLGNVGDALAYQERRLGREHEKVKLWKGALTEASLISGWHLLADQRETDLIRKIVKRVSNDVNRRPLHVPENLFEMDSHLGAMYSLLDIKSKDVQMLGICGLGGIGKTTIAKATYNEIFRRFEHSVFLANVRETCEKFSRSGLLQLQEMLLSEMMVDVDMKIGNVDRGIAVVRNILRSRKVLIIIDDANRLDQLETLAGERDWFGPGSRIIITTRDEHLMVAHGVEKTYKVKPMSPRAALWLFSSAAFRNTVPEEDFIQLSHNVVDHVKGLPLALRVLGSFLRGRTKSEWRCAIEKLRRIPHGEIFSILKISFDGLDDYEKAIFLDLACFFKGECVDRVKEILKCCDLYPESGIRVLVDRFLITIEFEKVEMHDMIEEMGKEIVRRESPGGPGERSRLWFHEDVIHVLTDEMATNKIEGIKLDLIAPEEVCFSARAFLSMKRLRLFIARNVHHSGEAISFTNELRWLEWPEYNISSLPFGLGPKKLAGLYMPKSGLRRLGEELRLFRNLKFINLNYSTRLIQIPDVSPLHNLEQVDMEGCESLAEVHDSLGHLDKLVHLNFSNCSNLINFPRSLKLELLQRLILKGCEKLPKFPDILVEVKNMTELSLEETAINELPSSFGNLIGLKELRLKNCKKLKYISASIYKLQRLECIILSGCSQLDDFPEHQQENRDSGKNSPILAFPNIIYLDFESCSLSEVNFLKGLNCISTLTYLNLSGNKFTCLPAGIGKFTKLQQLNLASCRNLQEIVELPQNITHLFAGGCESLQAYPSLSSILNFDSCKSPWVRRIDFSGCKQLIQHPATDLFFDSWQWSFSIQRGSDAPQELLLDRPTQGLDFEASKELEFGSSSMDQSIISRWDLNQVPDESIQELEFGNSSMDQSIISRWDLNQVPDESIQETELELIVRPAKKRRTELQFL